MLIATAPPRLWDNGISSKASSIMMNGFDRMLTVSRDLVEVFVPRTGKHERAFLLRPTRTLLGNGEYQETSPTYLTPHSRGSIRPPAVYLALATVHCKKVSMAELLIVYSTSSL
jgi:hypothetical protein